MGFTVKFRGRQKDGRLVVDDHVRFAVFVRSLGDGDLEIVIRKAKRERSDRQNSYYWGVVIALLSEHTGMEQQDVHEAMKQMFLSRAVFVPVKGGVKEVSVCGSTSLLKTDEFEVYLEKIKRWAAGELSVVIPDPQNTEAA